MFFLIILVLVGLATYGSLKERQSKKAKDLEKEMIYNETKQGRYEFLISFGIYIEYLEKYLENYDPLKGTISLGQVNNYGLNLLNKIRKSDEINLIYKDAIRKEELKEHIDGLVNTKPSNWKKDKHEHYNILRAKSAIILDSEKNLELVKEMRKNYENEFTKFIGNK